MPQFTAAELGKRLPTKEEFEVLCELPQVWDNDLKGKWFAERKEDLGNPNKSLFFPAAGFRYDGTLHNQGVNGYYWSSTTANGGASVYVYLFGATATNPDFTNNDKASGFSIRCVK